VPTRPLLLVAALVAGDYLLWTWSSDGASPTIALISGLALAPLILALLWLVSVTVARVLLGHTPSRGARPARRTRAARGRRQPTRPMPPAEQWEEPELDPATPARQSSEKLAA
jgi:fatty acid desaturase